MSLKQYLPQRRAALVSIAALLCLALSIQSPQGLAQSASAASTARPTLLVFGDSLSAEYGLKRASGWVSLLEDRLKKEGFPYRIVNASISGETTAGGLSRLSAVLNKHQPRLVLLQLGANDGLRGLPISQTEANLRKMLELVSANGGKAVIIGIRLPPNYGMDYAREFDSLFMRIGSQTNTPVVPFLLDGFAQDPNFFQADGIHPNERAQPRMLLTVWSTLQSHLAKP